MTALRVALLCLLFGSLVGCSSTTHHSDEPYEKQDKTMCSKQGQVWPARMYYGFSVDYTCFDEDAPNPAVLKK